MRVSLASIDDIDAIWQHFGEKLHKVTADMDSPLSSAELYMMCRAGGAVLFSCSDDEGFRAMAVCRPETWPSGSVLMCLAMVGEGLNDWLEPLIEEAARFARILGCQRFAWSGRKGWERIHPNAKVHRVVMTMEL